MAYTDAGDFAQEQEQLAGQRCVSTEHFDSRARGEGQLLNDRSTVPFP